MYAIFGWAIALRMRWRSVISIDTTDTDAVFSVTELPSNRVTVRPSSFLSKSSRLVATKSIKGALSASSSVKALLCSTACSAICALRPRLVAIVRT
jgi:hypothetical protein